MINLFQYHKFRELFLIEQNVEVKIDLEILGVSLNVYNLWVSSFIGAARLLSGNNICAVGALLYRKGL